MRARTVAAPIALAGAIALALVPAVSASAADQTWSGTGGIGQWWSDASAFTVGPLVDNDSAIFSDASPGIQTESSIRGFGGALTLDEVRFDVSHRVAGSDTALTVTGGVSVADDAVVLLNSDVFASGAQTWSVGSGASLRLPGVISTDAVGGLTLDVDGTLEIAGNLDGLGVGSVVQTGDGRVIRSGALGGGISGGYVVDSGEFFLAGATIAGTDVSTRGGAVTGDGVVGNLVISDGALAPGDPAADPYGLIGAEGYLAFEGGIYLVDIDPVLNANDYVITRGQLFGAETVLLPVTTSTPTVGQMFSVAGAWLEGAVDPDFRFLSPEGVVLADGDEFVIGDQRWAITYTTGAGGEVVIEFLGLVPPPLPATGQVNDWLLPVAIIAGGIVLIGGVIVIIRAVRSRRSSAS